MDVMKQCEATTPASTYAEAHRCLKRHGIKARGKRQLCAHHRGIERDAFLSAAREKAVKVAISAQPKQG